MILIYIEVSWAQTIFGKKDGQELDSDGNGGSNVRDEHICQLLSGREE